MRRSLLALSTVALVVLSTTLSAQARRPAAPPRSGGFSMGYTDIGPTIGLGNLGGASIDFGGRFEHAIKALPDMGNGILGIQASAEYYSWSGVGWSYKYIPIGVTGNYHFKLDDPKLDPFVGLGLGYNVVSCSYSGLGGNFGCGYSSGIYFIGRAGGRYFFSPNMSAYADVGAGAATLSLGIMFKIM